MSPRHTINAVGAICLILLLGAAGVSAQKYMAQSQDLEKKIDRLIKQMTVEEKLGQMSQATGFSVQAESEIKSGRWGSYLNAGGYEDRQRAQKWALEESRLGIPLIYGRDVIHGYRTMFPIPLAQACSWNPEIVRKGAQVAAAEASADGYHWTFAPMVDITRDPRWGRIAETLGEDPYLSGRLGAAMVQGFQGDDLASPHTIAACAKHYVGYGATEAGKDYNTTWIPDIQMFNVFLPPFKAAKEAGAATFMSAFNDINGVPASSNEFTLKTVLRGQWGFDGFVVSDWNSVTETIAHGFAEDAADAARRSLPAGVDMEMVSTSYYDHVKQLLADGRINMTVIDEAVRNILRVKMRLNLWEQSYGREDRASVLLSDDHLQAAREAAIQSAVLLKNDGILPLTEDIGKVAVVGPLAHSPKDQMGMWTLDGRADEVVTPLTALREMLGSDRVSYAPGLPDCSHSDLSGLDAAVQAAQAADVILCFVGEEEDMSGEARCRAFLNLPGGQIELVARLAETGKPMVLVVMAGRPLTFARETDEANAVLFAWHNGTMGGPAVADLLFGKANPSGRLAVTFPRTVGQVPIYYSHRNTGRPPSEDQLGIPMGTPQDPQGYSSKYLDVDFTPAYAFGFGLSYHTCEYSDLTLSAESFTKNGKLTVSVNVKNIGDRDGVETVQLYIRDLVGSVTRPVKELKDFMQIALKAGESRKVSFTLTAGQLAFYNADGSLQAEPGRFKVWVGPSSATGLEGEFTLTE